MIVLFLSDNICRFNEFFVLVEFLYNGNLIVIN